MNILFIYPDPPGFSGQRAASELVLRELGDDSWRFAEVRVPGFPRTGGGVGAVVSYVGRLLGLYPGAAKAALSGVDAIYLNVSQSLFTLRRDGWLLGLVRAMLPGVPVVMSLHGSVFMSWERGSAEQTRFLRLLREAALVTVLGESQRAVLTGWGIAESRVEVVPNTCEVALLEREAVRAKQRGEGPVEVLHLSTLMEPKGYPEVVEAARDLGERVRLTLCGKLTSTRYDRRFGSLAEAERWLREATGRGGIEWTEGAYGDRKRDLFHRAQIFVFPSWYPVEAQPLVLLEAMASGCAIVTTGIGEIGAMLDADSAWMLPDASCEAVTEALATLAGDAALREKLALAAWERFQERFTLEQYGITWRRIFRELGRGPGENLAASRRVEIAP